MYIIIAKYKISCEFPQLCSTHKVFEKLMRKNKYKLLYDIPSAYLLYKQKGERNCRSPLLPEILFHFWSVTLPLLHYSIVCASIVSIVYASFFQHLFHVIFFYIFIISHDAAIQNSFVRTIAVA